MIGNSPMTQQAKSRGKAARFWLVVLDQKRRNDKKQLNALQTHGINQLFHRMDRFEVFFIFPRHEYFRNAFWCNLLGR